MLLVETESIWQRHKQLLSHYQIDLYSIIDVFDYASSQFEHYISGDLEQDPKGNGEVRITD